MENSKLQTDNQSQHNLPIPIKDIKTEETYISGWQPVNCEIDFVKTENFLSSQSDYETSICESVKTNSESDVILPKTSDSNLKNTSAAIPAQYLKISDGNLQNSTAAIPTQYLKISHNNLQNTTIAIPVQYLKISDGNLQNSTSAISAHYLQISDSNFQNATTTIPAQYLKISDGNLQNSIPAQYLKISDSSNFQDSASAIPAKKYVLDYYLTNPPLITCPNPNVTMGTYKGPFRCNKCDYICSTKETLKYHVNDVHKKQYHCTICNFECDEEAVLVIHKYSVHNREKSFECSNYDFTSSSTSKLTKHEKDVRNIVSVPVKSFQFKGNHKTSFKSSLKTRINNMHFKIKSFQCIFCNFKCNSKTRLTNHENAKHLGLKQYQCGQCDYKCFFKGQLCRHTQRKHISSKIKL